MSKANTESILGSEVLLKQISEKAVSGDFYDDANMVGTLPLNNNHLRRRMFAGNTQLRSVELPELNGRHTNGAQFINAMFQDCSNLEHAHMPKLTLVDDNMFNGTKLTRVTDDDFPLVATINESGFANNSALTEVSLSSATNIGNSAFKNCTSLEEVNLPSVTGIGAYSFQSCTSLKRIDLPECTTSNESLIGVFSGCSSLEHINAPKLRLLGQLAFSYTTSLKTAVFQSMTQIRNACFDNSGIEKLDLPSCSSVYDFGLCASLDVLVLRRTSGVATNQSSACFNKTPFKGYGGTYSGHIYVPAALLESYRTATNWSTMYANYSDLFRTIEGSEYETKYVDGTDIPTE